MTPPPRQSAPVPGDDSAAHATRLAVAHPPMIGAPATGAGPSGARSEAGRCVARPAPAIGLLLRNGATARCRARPGRCIASRGLPRSWSETRLCRLIPAPTATMNLGSLGLSGSPRRRMRCREEDVVTPRRSAVRGMCRGPAAGGRARWRDDETQPLRATAPQDAHRLRRSRGGKAMRLARHERGHSHRRAEHAVPELIRTGEALHERDVRHVEARQTCSRSAAANASSSETMKSGPRGRSAGGMARASATASRNTSANRREGCRLRPKDAGSAARWWFRRAPRWFSHGRSR
jgi:hypothetical protein